MPLFSRIDNGTIKLVFSRKVHKISRTREMCFWISNFTQILNPALFGALTMALLLRRSRLRITKPWRKRAPCTNNWVPIEERPFQSVAARTCPHLGPGRKVDGNSWDRLRLAAKFSFNLVDRAKLHSYVMLASIDGFVERITMPT
jgi:hypothetical protein